ncbi:hypothetical protein CDD83_5003 [Cordyceps sp. RAO-2017]|nr:hypothetical protein CDD83_5003 [Cordyceps sp. RAO-2017]
MPATQATDVAPRLSSNPQNGCFATGSALRSRSNSHGLEASLNVNGCFESDRVTKCGYVKRRTRKTKKWKTAFIVLRRNTLSVYKNEKETKLRHQVYLSDLTAVAFLKDPKHKRDNVFGLFSPSKNFHLQASTTKDAQEWVDLIRKDARIEEEEEEMFLASPTARRLSPTALIALTPPRPGHGFDSHGGERLMVSGSPETHGPPEPVLIAPARRESSNVVDWSDLSGNELASHSDLSDDEGQNPHGVSRESLGIQSAAEAVSTPRGAGPVARPLARRSASQLSTLDDKSSGNGNNSKTKTISVGHLDQDPDRVVWQGWLWMLRSKGGVRQWKHLWAVLRPRILILYKDESEYAAQWLVQLSVVVNVVDIDPLSKSKKNCLQVITEEKSYRFCAHDEESLVHLIGAFKSLLAKRRGLEAHGGSGSRLEARGTA